MEVNRDRAIATERLSLDGAITRRPDHNFEYLGFILAAGFAAVLFWWQRIGLLGSDDLSYASGAVAWLEHGPSIGTDHWTLRYPVVVPLALSFALFGKTVFALVLPSLIYFGVMAIALTAFVRRRFGSAEAIATLVFLVIMPIAPALATTEFSDISEACFLILSLIAFVKATETTTPFWPVLAGVWVGLGFLSRETSVTLVGLYALLFLVAPGMPRHRYLWIALGAGTVVGAELACFWVIKGDPLYRLNLSREDVNRLSGMIEARSRGFVVDTAGNVRVNAYVDPILMLFATTKYGLLFYFAIPAAAVLARSRMLTAKQRYVLWLAVGLAAGWFLFIAMNGQVLFLEPRYLLVTGVLMCVPAGIGLVHLWRSGRRVLAASLLAAVAGCALLLMMLQNTDPLFAQERLAGYAASTTEQIYVGHRVAAPVNFLLAARGASQRVVAQEPPSGALTAYLQTKLYARPGVNPTVAQSDLVKQEQFAPPERLIGRLLKQLGLSRRLPPDIWDKLDRSGDTLVLYRVR